MSGLIRRGRISSPCGGLSGVRRGIGGERALGAWVGWRRFGETWFDRCVWGIEFDVKVQAG